MNSHVIFANFCIHESFDPKTAMELIQINKAYCREAERQVNVVTDQEKLDTLSNQLEEIAGKLGLQVIYPGLQPHFQRIDTGFAVYIPPVI